MISLRSAYAFFIPNIENVVFSFSFKWLIMAYLEAIY